MVCPLYMVFASLFHLSLFSFCLYISIYAYVFLFSIFFRPFLFLPWSPYVHFSLTSVIMCLSIYLSISFHISLTSHRQYKTSTVVFIFALPSHCNCDSSLIHLFAFKVPRLPLPSVSYLRSWALSTN